MELPSEFFYPSGICQPYLINKYASDENKFSFKTVETIQFVPTPSYIQTCVDHDDVRRFLQISRYRKPVYVITGLKVVTGIEANMLTSRAVRNSPTIQIDSTLPHVGPINLSGLGTESKAAAKAVTEWKSSDDFVFAFRVSKVIVGKATGQVVSEEDYRKGAMFGNDEELQEIKRPQLSILKVECPDAECEGFDAEELMEGEDVVVCAILRERHLED